MNLSLSNILDGRTIANEKKEEIVEIKRLIFSYITLYFHFFALQQQPKSLDSYVGFANLPNQLYRKSVKQGFEFTLMVVGKLF